MTRVSLRDKIAGVIIKELELDFNTQGFDYNPDTCHKIAAKVTALLVEELTGQWTYVLKQGPINVDRERSF